MPRREGDTKEVVLAREHRAWELTQKGWTQRRIAAMLGVSHQAVAAMLARATERIAANIEAIAKAVTVQQIHRLDHIAHESLLEWERSRLPSTKVQRHVKKGAPQQQAINDDPEEEAVADGPAPTLEEVMHITVAGRLADPRYLLAALKAYADQRELLGLNAPGPSATDLRDRADGIAEQYDLNTAELVALADRIARGKRGR